MKKWTICFMLGSILLTSRVYLSTLLSTKWIITGALLSVIGGAIMGGSSFFLPKPTNKSCGNL
ncbi:hypothetical protein FQV26_09580 [Planococcus sp. CPCC 101016]|uniref:hypothetical protein n=1 Tax=Planococcus sp. CPCC 101016 TaxID=2599617 RepID=UPI0011B62E45|nr:hypothetical protein [Planococcus sp. CPCC 101016]TWT08040.1 hypothetical protein FQV26_09580 [Planococcus sp. CPCC 101016]